MKQETEDFFKAVEKHYINFLSAPKTPELVHAPIIPQELDKKPLSKKKRKNSKKEEAASFLRLVEEYQEYQTKFQEKSVTITIQDLTPNNPNKLYKVIDVPSLSTSSQGNKRIHANDEIWAMIPYRTLTPHQKFQKYKKLKALVIYLIFFISSKV